METEERVTAVNQMKSWLAANREQLLEAGVVQIVAGYSGEGDEGSLNEIEFLDKEARLMNFEELESLLPLFEKLHEELSPDG